MPPKKKVLSLDQFQTDAKPAPKPKDAGAKNNNNKGFHTVGADNGNGGNNYQNKGFHTNNNNGGYHSNNNYHNNNHNGGSNNGGGNHQVNRKYNNNNSDSNASLHQPYWPISLVNAYTLPYSIPLPVHWTADDLHKQFTTNAQARAAKKNEKNGGYNNRYNNKNNQQQQDDVKETDGERVVDTQMRNLYIYGLENLIDTQRGVILSEPTPDIIQARNIAQKTSHLDPKKVTIPAFSSLLPEVPYKELKHLNEIVYQQVASDTSDYFDNGKHSQMITASGSQLTVEDELNALFNSQFSDSANPQDTIAAFEAEVQAGPKDNVKDIMDFNIPQLISKTKYYNTFSGEYPCLVEGELAIIQRDRNNYLRVPGLDYDIMVNGPGLNRAFHGDHVVANMMFPHQWRVQRVIPMTPEEVLNKSGGGKKDGNNNQQGQHQQQQQKQGGGGKGAFGSQVGQWCAARQVAEINAFLDSISVQKLVHIEYLRQVDYWFKACHYGVYSMPVQTEDDTTTASNALAEGGGNGLFSPKTPAHAPTAENIAGQQIDNEDEYNTTMFIDKTSTIYGYTPHDITTLSLYDNVENSIIAPEDEYENNNNQYGNNNKLTTTNNNKNKQIIEQYLYTKKMWQKYKDKRVNALYSHHPTVLTNFQSSAVSKGGVVVAAEDNKVQRVFEPDQSDPTKFKEALFDWYQTLKYQSATSQALSSDVGMISPLTPPSLTGPLPILNWNPSMWYVNFMMALLHAFFPAYQFQPTSMIVSIRNNYGPQIKFQLPPISKVFGYWLQDTDTAQTKLKSSDKPNQDELGYLYDNFVTKCQYSDLPFTKHITTLVSATTSGDNNTQIVEQQQQQTQKKKGGKSNQQNDINPYHNPYENRGVVWYRGYNAQLASTAYNFLVDVTVTANNNNNTTTTTSNDLLSTNDRLLKSVDVLNQPTLALPEEEIGKANNNKKSLYPCLPDNIKNVLLGRDRYFCSTFVSMKITSVAFNIWNAALSFPIDALTTHIYNNNFKDLVKKYQFAVENVLNTIRTCSATNNLTINSMNKKPGQTGGAGGSQYDGGKKWNEIQVQVQPQNLRFPPVKLSLSYTIVHDIADTSVKYYCESHGIIYDQYSTKSTTYLNYLRNIKKEQQGINFNNGDDINNNFDDIQPPQDALLDLLGPDYYTYPSQIMLDIKGVDIQLLATHAPKLYSWFLCTLSRLNSIATFIEQKFLLCLPLIKLKESELAFSSGKFGGVSAAKVNNNNNGGKKQQQHGLVDGLIYNENENNTQQQQQQQQPQRQATPVEEKINVLIGTEIQRTVPFEKMQYLLLEPQDVQLGNIFGNDAAHLTVGTDGKSGGFQDKHSTQQNGTGGDNNNNGDNKKGNHLTEEEHQRLIQQRVMYLSTLDTIQVGPVGQVVVPKQQEENSIEKEDVPVEQQEETTEGYELQDLSTRVIQPTYALTQIEGQALSQYIPGLFIIQYTSWHCNAPTPTITIHNESGGSDIITSSDKLLPVLIKNKISQSDVFSPLIEAELQATIENLSKTTATTSNGLTSPSVADIAKKGEWRVPQDEIDSRADLRGMLIFSIDPLTAKDLDDTLSMEYVGLSTDYPNGYFPTLPYTAGPKAIFRVGVHIADVSFFVRAHTLLDQEACNRSTSVYLSTFVIPMLPRILCEELCSLNQGKDRLAFSCFFLMDEDGNVLDIERHVKAENTLRYNERVDGLNDTDALTKERLTNTDKQQTINKKPAQPMYINEQHKVYKLKDLINPGQANIKGTNQMVTTEKNSENVTTMTDLQDEFKYHNDITDSDDDEDAEYIYDDQINSKQRNNLHNALEQFHNDDKSKDMKIRKRKVGGSGKGKKKAMYNQMEGSDDDSNVDVPSDDDDEYYDDETSTKPRSNKNNTKEDNNGKETITPHEAWNKYVTETAWYGKSIIRSALKLDYGTAMLLVECAYQDPLYNEMLEQRQQLIADAVQKQQQEGGDIDEQTKLLSLLQQRSPSTSLQCADWAALSPLDIVTKTGLHSDDAIMRQIAAHHELSQLFLSSNGRCRPPNYCSKYWSEDIYNKMDLDPNFINNSTTGQDLIPDIARACRLLHSLGMKRRQTRLTVGGSLTLTRNKLSFKQGYQLDYFYGHDNVAEIQQKNNGTNDNDIVNTLDNYRTNTNTLSIPLPNELQRSVQHYTLYPLHDTNRMIEEYMLLANEFVAKRIYRILPKNALLRKHPEPDSNKLSLTTQFLHKLGVPLRTDTAGILQQSLVTLQQQYNQIVKEKFNALHFNFDLELKQGKINKFEEICYRLYLAGSDVRSIAEEMFCQAMIAAEYFPTGFQQLNKEELLDVSKKFGISSDPKKDGKSGGRGGNNNKAKAGGKRDEDFGKNKGKANNNSALVVVGGGNSKDDKSGNNIKDNYQFKWALECEWIKKFKHYALNMDFYTHFTSPIRRYPDIVVHRVLECSLAIEPACNTLPFSPYYVKKDYNNVTNMISNVDTTLDNIMIDMKKMDLISLDSEILTKPQETSSYPTRLELDTSVFDLVKLVTPPSLIKNTNTSNKQTTTTHTQQPQQPQYAIQSLTLQSPTNNNNNNNKPVLKNNMHLVKIKGISSSLPNAQTYIKTTTPQLLHQQCERFNEQKRMAKYAGDESNNLMFSELILKRQYQLQWLINYYYQHYNKFEYQQNDENNNFNSMTPEEQEHASYIQALLLQQEEEEREYKTRLQQGNVGNGTQQQTPLNCVPTTPDSIGIAYAQQFFAIEQPLLPKGYDLWNTANNNNNNNQNDVGSQYQKLIQYYFKELFFTINKQYKLNIEAFLTLLTDKCIMEGKSPYANASTSTNTTGRLLTKQYVIQMFLKAPILVEKGVVLGCTNRSKPNEMAVFLPRTQQTIQIPTDTQNATQILPSLIKNEPLININNNNVGCTIIQGSYLLSTQNLNNKMGLEGNQNVNINGKKETFMNLLNDVLIKPAGNNTTQGGDYDEELLAQQAEYDEYDAEWLNKEKEDQRLLLQAEGYEASTRVKPTKVGMKKQYNKGNANEFGDDETAKTKDLKKTGIFINQGKKTNQYAESIGALDIDSMWLITWDPLFYSLAWFQWTPIIDMSKRIIPHNSLTLEDCALCLPHYIKNGIWSNFITQNKDKLVFFPQIKDLASPPDANGNPTPDYQGVGPTHLDAYETPKQQQKIAGVYKEKHNTFNIDGTDNEQPTYNPITYEEDEPTTNAQQQLPKISSITTFSPFAEGIRLFDVVRVVLLPMIPELTFKPLLIPNCVIEYQDTTK